MFIGLNIWTVLEIGEYIILQNKIYVARMANAFLETTCKKNNLVLKENNNKKYISRAIKKKQIKKLGMKYNLHKYLKKIRIISFLQFLNA